MMTRREIEKIAMLARLEFNESELDRFTDQFNKIIEFIGQLQKVDTEGVEPTSHPIDVKTPFREDEVRSCLDPGKVAALGPDVDSGFFRVPKVIE